MYRRLIILIIFVCLIVYNALFIKFDNFNEKVKINVEVKYNNQSSTYELDKGSTLNDLLKILDYQEDLDLNALSLNEVLYHNEIINLNDDDKQKISLNQASLEELCSLPGIGNSLANKIIEYRNLHYGFNNLDELKNVSGIGEKKYQQIKGYLAL